MASVREALTTDPTYASTHAQLAEALRQMGLTPEAAGQLDQARQLGWKY